MNGYSLIVKRSSLNGEIQISGFKHSAVPILCSSLLPDEGVCLRNIPMVEDIKIILKIIKDLGNSIALKEDNREIIIQRKNILMNNIDYNLLKKVHGALYLLPIILRINGYVRFPRKLGGCSIGNRPIINIAYVLRKMGCRVKITKEYIEVRRLREPQEVEISLNFNSKWDKFRSGATKTALIYGVLSNMKIKLSNAYLRLEILDLINFLNTMNAKIKYDLKKKEIIIHGVKKLKSAEYSISPDYLELLTFICAAGITKGSEITIYNVPDLKGFYKEIEICKKMGIELNVKGDYIVAKSPQKTLYPCNFSTKDISTDIQPIFSTTLSLANGISYIKEVVWENRFRFVSELKKMRAKIHKVNRNIIKIEGVNELIGNVVEGKDTRTTAALILAGITAKGFTFIKNANHLERGYENLPDKLKSIGADIEVIRK